MADILKNLDNILNQMEEDLKATEDAYKKGKAEEAKKEASEGFLFSGLKKVANRNPETRIYLVPLLKKALDNQKGEGKIWRVETGWRVQPHGMEPQTYTTYDEAKARLEGKSKEEGKPKEEGEGKGEAKEKKRDKAQEYDSPEFQKALFSVINNKSIFNEINNPKQKKFKKKFKGAIKNLRDDFKKSSESIKEILKDKDKLTPEWYQQNKKAVDTRLKRFDDLDARMRVVEKEIFDPLWKKSQKDVNLYANLPRYPLYLVTIPLSFLGNPLMKGSAPAKVVGSGMVGLSMALSYVSKAGVSSIASFVKGVRSLWKGSQEMSVRSLEKKRDELTNKIERALKEMEYKVSISKEDESEAESGE